jgi:hypothetical protein
MDGEEDVALDSEAQHLAAMLPFPFPERELEGYHFITWK